MKGISRRGQEGLPAAFFACALMAVSWLWLATGPAAANIANEWPFEELEANVPPRIASGGFENDPFFRLGYLNVALYGAIPDDGIDDTESIQAAMDDGYLYDYVVYLPGGTYTISDTLNAMQRSWYVGVLDEWVPARRKAHVLVGEKHHPPVLKLANGSPGFDSPSDPKAVIQMWAQDRRPGWNPPGPGIEDQSGQFHFNQHIRGVDFDLRSVGNAGAVAIRFWGAQGGSLEDIHIEAEGAFAGLYDLPGTGGGVYNVSVNAGRYGIFVGEKKGYVTLAGISLFNQSAAAILDEEFKPMTVAGFHIVKEQGPAIVIGNKSGENAHGPVLVDGIIELEQGGQAVENLFGIMTSMKNVYFRNASTVIRSGANPAVTGTGDGWLLVRKYAATHTDLFERPSTHLVDGQLVGGELLSRVDNATPPPPAADVIARHVWNAAGFPSFEDGDVVNARDHGVAGDGQTDDTAALQALIDSEPRIFLPRGIYRVSDTLRLNSATQLVGAHQTFSRIRPDVATWQPQQEATVFMTDNDPAGATTLAFLGIDLPTADPEFIRFNAVHWRVGRDSMVRNLFLNDQGFTEVEAGNAFRNFRLTQGGGGRWYGTYAGNNIKRHSHHPDFRDVLVEGTTEPLRLYGFNSERGQAEPQSEIRDSENVAIFGFKSEGNQTPLRLAGATNVFLFGYGGNATPLEGRSIFDIVDSADLFISNIGPFLRPPENTPYGEPLGDALIGINVDPALSYSVHEHIAGQTVAVTRRHTIPLYGRGTPSLSRVLRSHEGNVAPVAGIAVTTVRGDAPLPVGFDGAGSFDPDGAVVSHEWDFGDGLTASGASAFHEYAEVGTYVATLTVFDDLGNAASTNVVIDAVAPPPPNVSPQASFVATPAQGEAPLAVSFDGSGSQDPDGALVSHAWDFGDGATGSGVSATHTYTAIGSFTVTLTVTDEAGDSDAAVQVIEVTQAAEPGEPAAEIIIDNLDPDTEHSGAYWQTSSSGSNWERSAMVNRYGGYFRWLPQFPAPGTYDVYAWWESDSRQSGAAPFTVHHAGGATTIHVDQRRQTHSGRWNLLGRFYFDPALAPNVELGVGNYGSSQADAVRFVPVAANAPPAARARADVAAGTAPLAVSFDALQSSDPDGTIASYRWDFGDGSVAQWGTQVTHTFAAGSYTVVLTVTDDSGASGVDSVDIDTVAPPLSNVSPQASFAATPAQGEAPLAVSFDGSGSQDPDGALVSHAWDFGDGGTGSGVSATHTYTASGSFTVTLTVTDDAGDSDAAVQVVEVSEPPPPNIPPQAAFVATPAQGEAPLAVSFDGSGSQDPDGALVSHAWDFGDGATGSGVSATHTYTAIGSFTVTLTVTDEAGDSDAAVQVIEVTQAAEPGEPAAEIIIDNLDPDTEHSGAYWQTSSSGSNWERSAMVNRYGGYFRWLPQFPAPGTYDVYAWWESDSRQSGAAPFTVHHAGGATTIHVDQRRQTHSGRWNLLGRFYFDPALAPNVELGVGNYGSSQADAVRFVPVAANAPPAARARADVAAGTAPLAVSFDALQSSDPDGTIASYRWDFGDGSVAQWGTQVTHTFAAGSYTVVLTVTDDSGASGVDSVDIDAVAPPLSNVSPQASFAATPAQGEAPLAVSFDGSGSQDPDGALVSHAWDFGDGGTGSGVSATHTYTASGSFTVTLTVTDDAGDSDAAVQVVEVSEPPPPNVSPQASFVATPAQGEAPLAVSFDGSGSQDPDGALVSHAWDFGDGGTGSGVSATHTYSATGSFTVTLTVTDEAGDSDAAVQVIEVTQAAEPGEPAAEIIIDNLDPDTEHSGAYWQTSSSGSNWERSAMVNRYGGYFRWLPQFPAPGTYDVYAWWESDSRQSGAAPFTVHHAGGATTIHVDQRRQTHSGRWNLLGRFYFDPALAPNVELGVGNYGSSQADAVRFVPVP